MQSNTPYFIIDDPTRIVTDYYDLTKNELGKGSYGKVRLAKLKGTNLKRAIKIIDKSKVRNVERFRIEVEIMMKLDHPNILRILDYFEDLCFVYLVLELCTGGELYDRIVSNHYYDENDARVIFKQIINAIYYCHINGVCHRDLKPENFMMISKEDPFTLKMIDFGLSRTFQSESFYTQATLNENQNIQTGPTKVRKS
jgi:calcium-dependent protein kinase